MTAQKYQQRAFDVPISMTVVGGARLRRLRITNLEDLQFSVPGLYVDNNGNTMEVTLRGVSNQFGQGALVGMYLDEADVTSEAIEGPDLNVYDLTRVAWRCSVFQSLEGRSRTAQYSLPYRR